MSDPALRLVEKEDMDKSKALDAALGQIERAFGKGSIMKLGQQENAVELDAISTGSLGLDIALGIGRLPRRRIIEIYPLINEVKIKLKIIRSKLKVLSLVSL